MNDGRHLSLIIPDLIVKDNHMNKESNQDLILSESPVYVRYINRAVHQ